TGGMLVPLTAFALDEFGWRATAFGSGILILVVGMPLVQVVRHRPEPYGLRPDGDPPPPPGSSADDNNAGQVEMPSFTAREALRTWAFWAIALGHGSALLIVASVNVHVITHLNESLGYSLA